MLTDPAITATLDRLHAAADRNDPAVIDQALTVAAERGATSDAEVADVLAAAAMPVAPAVGRLLHALALSRRDGLIVEFGCSLGLSTTYLAAALGAGTPPMITTEQEPSKVERARAHLAEAGLGDRVDLRAGDALDTLAGLDQPVSLLFLDGWKGLYLPVLQLLEPCLVDGAIVVADDTTLLPELCASYLAHVRDESHGYASAEIALDDGLELSVRTR